MKRLVWLGLAVVGWIYVSGFLSLGHRGAMTYLNEWEEHSMNGDAERICELMHEDLEFSIDDRSMPGRPLLLQGGKAELCDYYTKVVPAMKHVVSGMNLTRENVEIDRDWRHPWTADVSYTEHRSISMAVAQMQVNSIGEDRVTLVKTLTNGLKIKRLHAKTRTTDPAAT